ncbi:MAG: protein translocase subunit SecF, partial [Alphaproteobacteria bacterium]|nr:protein translocase subunit SecF [Alphaproteobacteria bacterium]
VGSMFLLATRGLNLGIDFTGGTLIEVRVETQPDIEALRSDLASLELGAISIQEFGDPKDLLIRMGQQKGGEEVQKLAITAVKDKLAENFDEIDYRRVEYVGPQVGGELKKAGLMAFGFSMIGILLYVWFRFEWQFGVAAIMALLHDTIGVLGFFALTQASFDLATLAAVLLVAGYSINDTVVVFDRIRENLRKYKKKLLPDLFNMSVNQMLSRSIMTSITTLLALVALFVFGGEVIRGFVDALIFGVALGTYSSVYVAAPLLMLFRLPRGEIKTKTDKETSET